MAKMRIIAIQTPTGKALKVPALDCIIYEDNRIDFTNNESSVGMLKVILHIAENFNTHYRNAN